MKSIKPIIFCDFDGVLCHDRYWRSLPPNEHEKVQKLLFGVDNTLVGDWMRGKYTAEEINTIVSEKTGISFEKLWSIFLNDCKTMYVSKEILEKLGSLRNRYIVILMTDNMDSFTRFTSPLLGLDSYFDYICNSFYENLLKTDSDGEIYIKCAQKFNVSIEDCIVLDDSKKVCEVIKKLGATHYLIAKNENIGCLLKKLEA